jgi:hypothetical protein
MSATKHYLAAQEEYIRSLQQPPVISPEERSRDHTTPARLHERDRAAAYRSAAPDTVQLHRQRPRANPAAEATLTPIRDAEGYDLKPNPLVVTTTAELIAALREYRAWAGSPPYRTMAAQARQVVAHSTMYTTLNSDAELPRLKVILAIIAGCGGGDEEQRAWATAWRRITLGKLDVPVTSEAPTLLVVPMATETTR